MPKTKVEKSEEKQDLSRLTNKNVKGVLSNLTALSNIGNFVGLQEQNIFAGKGKKEDYCTTEAPEAVGLKCRKSADKLQDIMRKAAILAKEVDTYLESV